MNPQVRDERSAISYAASLLRGGGVVAFPTETVYGLGADAANKQAVRRIFSIKGRPADHPLIVHLADAGMINRWAQDIPADALRLAERLNDTVGYGQALYASLRRIDSEGYDKILIEAPPESEPWRAVSDRLRRAAGNTKNRL